MRSTQTVFDPPLQPAGRAAARNAVAHYGQAERQTRRAVMPALPISSPRSMSCRVTCTRCHIHLTPHLLLNARVNYWTHQKYYLTIKARLEMMTVALALSRYWMRTFHYARHDSEIVSLHESGITWMTSPLLFLSCAVLFWMARMNEVLLSHKVTKVGTPAVLEVETWAFYKWSVIENSFSEL